MKRLLKKTNSINAIEAFACACRSCSCVSCACQCLLLDKWGGDNQADSGLRDDDNNSDSSSNNYKK